MSAPAPTGSVGAVASGAAAPALSASKLKAAKLAARHAALLARSQSLLPADACWSVDVHKSAGRRGLATREVLPGTTIVDECAAGWIVKNELADARCAECTRPIEPTQRVSCSVCGLVHFCSPACEALAAPLHAFVCPLMPHVAGIASACSVDVDMLRLVAVLVAGWSLEQQTLKSAETAAEPASSSVAAAAAASPSAPKFTRGRWQDVQDLVAHVEHAQSEWVKVIEQSMRQMIDIYKKNERFAGLKTPDLQTVSCTTHTTKTHDAKQEL